MPKPAIKPNRVIRSQQVLEALTALVRRRLPLTLQNTRITEDDLLYVLGYAAVHQLTPEAACEELAEAPSGNRFREVLKAALPPWPQLQRQLNTILRAQLPRTLLKGKRSYCLAGDVTLIPYHGQPAEDEAEVVRGEAKSGTTHFHGYATIAVVHPKRRYVVALRYLRAGETMAEVLRWLLDRVKRLGIQARRVYLDQGFCTIEVYKALDRRRLSYIVPLAVRGKSGGVRELFVGQASYATRYTLASEDYGAYTVAAVVVRRYAKGRYGRHGVMWFAYGVARLPAGVTPAQVFELYRQRFGIETSYRQMNRVRARTASRSPEVRLLLVGLAFILVNLYVALRDRLATGREASRFAGERWFSLRRLALMLGRAVEQLLGVAEVIQHRRSPALS